MAKGGLAPAGAGAVLTAICIGLALLGEVVPGWPWRTNAIILLALAVFGIGGLSVSEWSNPPNWAGGYKDLYTELSGREVDAGRLSWLSRPEGEIHSLLLLAAIVPAIALIILLVVALA